MTPASAVDPILFQGLFLLALRWAERVCRWLHAVPRAAAAPVDRRVFSTQERPS